MTKSPVNAEDSRRYAVRRPVPADASALARAHRRAWHEAYDALMTPEAIDATPVAELAHRWRTRLEVDEPDAVVVVGVDAADEVVGFASAGPPRDDDAPVAWELYALNVVSTAYGSGLAQELVRQAVGERAAVLWVLVDNPRARAFYAEEGFVDDGSRKLHQPSGLEEMRMIRRGPRAVG